MKKICTKIWSSIPFAHRAPKHDGHCRFIHGHNWVVSAVFAASVLDENGFVMDFGKLKPFKQWLDAEFDHSLVLSSEDGDVCKIVSSVREWAKIRIVSDCSCEGLAELFFKHLIAIVDKQEAGRVSVVSLTVFEDEKNSATVTL